MILHGNEKKSTLKINAVSAILLQLVTAVIGIFLPRFVLGAFGSQVNGLMSSITQFLSYIALMEAGTGSVVKAAMFKPLVDGDRQALSAVLRATQKFFRTIAYVFLGYLALLSVLYPLLAEGDAFSYEYVFSLVWILGISTFSQYFFCLTYRILLQADQKIYFDNFVQIITLIANFVICLALIFSGASVHIVKLVSAIVFLLPPILINVYVRKKYDIDRKAEADSGALKQRWDGLAHHLAFFVHKNTDVAVLTFFTNYTEISVYVVYNMIVTAIQGMLSSIASSVTSKFGELLARGDRARLEQAFSQYETLIFCVSTALFSVTGIMIVPFVSVYTLGITDADYVRPVFALLIVLAELVYAIRAPYSNMVFAAGRFKDTRIGAVIEAVLNVGLSIALVHWLGIVGVAIGTLIAMLYRTVDYVIYLRRHVLHRSVKHFIKNMLLTAAVFAIGLVICQTFVLPLFTFSGFGAWVICAALVAVIIAALVVAIQLVFNRRAFLASLHFFSN